MLPFLAVEVSEEMHDCYFVDLFVRPTNTAAIRFYEGLGYVIYRCSSTLIYTLITLYLYTSTFSHRVPTFDTSLTPKEVESTEWRAHISKRLGWTLFPGRILWLKYTEIDLGISNILILRYGDGLLFWWWGCLWYAQATAQGHFGWIRSNLLAAFCFWRSLVVIDLQRRVETKTYTQTLACALILHPRMKTENLCLVETMSCHLKPLVLL